VDNIDVCFTQIRCEDGRWLVLVQDCVQWRALMFSALNLRALLPQNYCC